MMIKRVIKKIQSSALVIGLIGLLVAANIAASFIPLRLDFSKGKAYTLSSATGNVLRDLKEPVTVTFFVSSDLPTRLLPLRTDVVDLLKEYAKKSNKVDLRIVDPKRDTKAKSETEEAGIPELQFSQVEQDKYAVTTAYFGIALSYAGKKEAIPQVTDTASLEYNLTSAIYKMTRERIARIGATGLERTTVLGEVAKRQFVFEPLAFATDSAVPTIPSTYDALMIIDEGTAEYSQEDISAFSAYLEQGGKAVFFVDGVTVSDALSASSAQNGFLSLFAKYGIQVQKNLVLSESAELVNFGNETVQILTPYPFWIRTDSFNTNASYFSNVQTLTFPWTSSLAVKKEDTRVTPLVYSPKRSWAQSETFELNPQAIPLPEESTMKEYMLAAESRAGESGKLVVIPSSRFIQDAYLGRVSGNLPFVLNILNDLVSAGALSGIYTRGVSFYPLPELTSSERDIFKYGTIFTLPLLFGLYGVFRLWRRRQRG